MSYPPFSGEDIVKVMINSGIYEWERTRGDHVTLRWEPPGGHEANARTVTVPLHDELSEGTLQKIADQAGAKDYQRFKEWIDQNR